MVAKCEIDLVIEIWDGSLGVVYDAAEDQDAAEGEQAGNTGAFPSMTALKSKLYSGDSSTARVPSRRWHGRTSPVQPNSPLFKLLRHDLSSLVFEVLYKRKGSRNKTNGNCNKTIWLKDLSTERKRANNSCMSDCRNQKIHIVQNSTSACKTDIIVDWVRKGRFCIF